MRQQLDEQRAEAAKARYFEATAAFVAAVETAANTFRRGGDFEDVFIQMESARVRMTLDSDAPNFMEELGHWPVLVWGLSMAAHSEHNERLSDGVPIETLIVATTILTTVVAEWPHSSPPDRSDMVTRLGETRKWAEEAAEQYDEIVGVTSFDLPAWRRPL